MGDQPTYNLRPVWDAILEIYAAFREVADRHGLRYYVTGGTALGAVRHGGFIPWDDDFDIIMPRRDYRAFFDRYAKELPAWYRATDFHQAGGSDFGFTQMFGKVYDNRPDVCRRVSEGSNLALAQGLFIDVIPIDGMPSFAPCFYWWAFRRSVWRHAYCSGLMWRILASVMRVPKDDCTRSLAFERWLMKFDFDQAARAWDYNGTGRMLKARTMSPKRGFGSPYWMKFDTVEVPLPQDYEVFLRTVFGDYQQLPPVEKRRPAHQQSVSGQRNGGVK